MVMQAVVRSLVKARSCGRHAENRLDNPFVLQPMALCDDCVSLGWSWRFDAERGWLIDRERQEWMD